MLQDFGKGTNTFDFWAPLSGLLTLTLILIIIALGIISNIDRLSCSCTLKPCINYVV